MRRLTIVSGAPWNTLVVAEWRETNSGTDGVGYLRGLLSIRLFPELWDLRTRL